MAVEAPHHRAAGPLLLLSAVPRPAGQGEGGPQAACRFAGCCGCVMRVVVVPHDSLKAIEFGGDEDMSVEQIHPPTETSKRVSVDVVGLFIER